MLIVEDGSIVAGADSYVSLSDARTLAAKYGWELPADDTEAEQALRNGAGYVGLQEPAMCGSRVSPLQELAYPRKNVTLYGFDVAQDGIPSQVIRAQVAAAVEYGAGTDVQVACSDRFSAAAHDAVDARPDAADTGRMLGPQAPRQIRIPLQPLGKLRNSPCRNPV